MVRAPAILGGFSRCSFEIQTDPFVVLRGQQESAPDVELAGKLVLNSLDSMYIRNIRVRLEGTRKVSWLSKAVNPQTISDKKVFLREDFYPMNNATTKGMNGTKAHKIGAGLHEWPFKFTIAGSLPESIEGMSGSYIVYNISAVVERGTITKSLTSNKHIRIIRTLTPDEIDSVGAMRYNADIWKNKIYYKIHSEESHFVFGSNVTVDFLLCPLKKGVEIGEIEMDLTEHVTLYCFGTKDVQKNKYSICVASQKFKVPENAAIYDNEEDPNFPIDEGYKFQLTFQLPKSLNKCRQSVETDQIVIEHKLKSHINLHNPEGHTSQLLVRNDIRLFISPNYPVGEDQTVVVDDSPSGQAALRNEDPSQAGPPSYSDHRLDILYSDIDTSTFSAVNSAVNTPFYGLSRNPSDENLGSMDAIARNSASTGGPTAQQLHNRLARLSVQDRHESRFGEQSHNSSGGNTPYNGPEDHHPASTPPSAGGDGYFSRSSGPSSRLSYSNPHSRHHSGGGEMLGPHAPTASDYDMDALMRTPSYSTAVRTPGVWTPSEQEGGLPSYEVATSRPSSPNHGRQRISRSASSTSSPSSVNSLETLREETEQSTQQDTRDTTETLHPTSTTIQHR